MVCVDSNHRGQLSATSTALSVVALYLPDACLTLLCRYDMLLGFESVSSVVRGVSAIRNLGSPT